jgi:hypothetical protein
VVAKVGDTAAKISGALVQALHWLSLKPVLTVPPLAAPLHRVLSRYWPTEQVESSVLHGVHTAPTSSVHLVN